MTDRVALRLRWKNSNRFLLINVFVYIPVKLTAFRKCKNRTFLLRCFSVFGCVEWTCLREAGFISERVVLEAGGKIPSYLQ